MWTCPKCGRTFKRNNQSHYCGKSPETIREYITGQPEESQSHLYELDRIISEALPKAQKCIKWSMPTYIEEEIIVQFAACKNHVSFYVGSEAAEQFKMRLSGYTCNKNAIYFDYAKPLPAELVREIVLWCSADAGRNSPF